MPTTELRSCPASELVTPDTYAQACMDVHADLWLQSKGTEYGGLRSGAMFTAVDESVALTRSNEPEST